MHRPKCGSEEKIKLGMNHGMQKYECKKCGCHYKKSSKRGYPDSIRRKVLGMYLEGMGFRRLERITSISNVTIMK